MADIKFLTSTDIRNVWAREDTHFTPWLSGEEPLRVLLDECGIDLGVDFTVITEHRVPGVNRKLDIYVETEARESIAIENQYAEANHDHFTRALAYAVGLGTLSVIVIAENHRQEFVELARYLNNAAGAYGENGIKVYLVKVDVYSSEDEETFYPSFELIVGPEDWKSVVSKSVLSQGDSRESLLYDFHDRMLPLLRSETGIFKNVKPTASEWKAGTIGIKGINICVSTSKNKTKVQIWLHTGRHTANFAGLEVLEKYQSELEELVSGYELIWFKQKTAYVEVQTDGVGYGTDPSDAELEEIARVAGLLKKFTSKYQDELREAVNSAEDHEGDRLWTKQELEVAVKTYLSMLREEEQGRDYMKVQYLRDAQQLIPNRTVKSVEFRMSNISAVLDDLGKPWIDGYKPARNVGRNVTDMITEILNNLDVP
tara:strand:+ start:188 stop:1471 length:1284 start_codon:yes stop_codon:yes gene_type:complete